ncbi:hypothetical protein LTR66_016661, partial [Elasticomyces elasticus]
MPLAIASELSALSKAVLQIYQITHQQHRTASAEFSAFREDVKFLGDVLEVLSTRLKRSEDRRNTSRRHLVFFQLVKDDVKRSVDSCEQLIHTNRWFSKGKDGVMQVVYWNAFLAKLVKAEQERIQICYHKVHFTLHEAHHDQALKIYANLTVTREQRRQDSLAARTLLPLPVRQNLRNVLDTRVLTLHEMIDAATFFLENSRENSATGPQLPRSSEPASYLDLLKAIWLLERIRSHPEHAQYNQDNYCLLWLDDLERRATGEAQQYLFINSNVRPVSDAQLLSLDESAYRLHLTDTQSSSGDDPLEASGMEETLMNHVSLESVSHGQATMSLFRPNESELKLKEMNEKQTSAAVLLREVATNNLNLNLLLFNPAYALREATLPIIGWKMDISQPWRFMTFRNRAEMYDFQKHLTGFKACYDQRTVKAATFKVGWRDRNGTLLTNHARAQLWMVPKVDDSAQSSGPSTPETPTQSDHK